MHNDRPGLVIAGGTAVTMNDEVPVVDPAWVHVRDGIIEQVSDTPITPGPEDRVLDATGKVVIPGIVNTHTHLWQVLIRGLYELLPFRDWLAAIYACGEHLTPEDCRIAAELGAVESLHSGVTTVLDHQFLHRGSEFADATIDALLGVGIRAVVARTIMDTGDIVPAVSKETPGDGLRAVEDLLTRYEGQRASGMLTVMTGPNTPGVSASMELAVATREFCQQHGIDQSMHVAESTTVRTRVREQHGHDGAVALLAANEAIGPETLAVHCVDLTASDIKAFADLGVRVAHNPVCNLFMGDGMAPVAEMLEAGITVGLGTDGAASNNSQDMLEVLKFASLVQRGRTQRADVIPPLRALRMATFDGARAAGIGHLVGSVEPGKRADLAVVDLRRSAHNVTVHDPVSALVHTARPPDVDTVIVDGQVVLEHGQVIGVDEGALFAEAQQAGEALAVRLRG